jgi:hypothetical protein
VIIRTQVESLHLVFPAAAHRQEHNRDATETGALDPASVLLQPGSPHCRMARWPSTIDIAFLLVTTQLHAGNKVVTTPEPRAISNQVSGISLGCCALNIGR